MNKLVGYPAQPQAVVYDMLISNAAEDNLDLYHHVFLLTLSGKLYLAPIVSDPQRILDIGTCCYSIQRAFWAHMLMRCRHGYGNLGR